METIDGVCTVCMYIDMSRLPVIMEGMSFEYVCIDRIILQFSFPAQIVKEDSFSVCKSVCEENDAVRPNNRVGLAIL